VRKRLGIEKIREDGDLHHAADAAVIATISPGLIQKLTEYYKREERFYATSRGYYDIETGKYLTREEYNAKYAPAFPPPWEDFRKELEMRLSDEPRRYFEAYGFPTYESDEEVRPVFVSRMQNHKATGEAHKATVLSGREKGYAIKKTPLTELKLKDGEIEGLYGTYNHKNDAILYNALKERLLAFGGDAAKAFAEPFRKPKADGRLAACKKGKDKRKVDGKRAC
jgi:CRISPR-associated endonuclease Csn1